MTIYPPPTSIVCNVGSILEFGEKKLKVISNDPYLYVPINYLFKLIFRIPRNIPGHEDLYEQFLLEHVRNIRHSDLVVTEFDELVSELDHMFETTMRHEFGFGIIDHIDSYCFASWMDNHHGLFFLHD